MTRVAFYSHDTFGLGHLRRCLKLASALTGSLERVEGLLMTGSPWADLFSPPKGFEIAPLPSIVKSGRSYEPRERGLGLEQSLCTRSRRIESLLDEFRPDLVIVDNVPCGLRGEMLPALRRVKDRPGSRCVLALRDVLDRLDRVRSEWSAVGAEEALEHLYDEVWVFGSDQSSAELTKLPGMGNGIPCIACGRLGLGHEFLPRSANDDSKIRVGGGQPRVLVTGGGGGDAMHLVQTYVEMLRLLRPPIDSQVVLGPDFCHRTWSTLNRNNGFAASISDFLPDLPQAMVRADVVVAMAGYNSICELEATGSRSVLVPRVWPREEQLIRAEAQERAGRATVVLPQELDPDTLWAAISRELDRPRPEPILHRGAQEAARRSAALLGVQSPERKGSR